VTLSTRIIWVGNARRGDFSRRLTEEIDGYDNNNGFSPKLTKQNSIDYLNALAKESRQYGMAIGLKNAQAILPAVADVVQFAVNEECVANDECSVYESFTNGVSSIAKPVLHVEYVEHSGSKISSSSPRLKGYSSDKLRNILCLEDQRSLKLSTAIRTLSLDGWMMDCDGSVTNTKTKPTS
jgi:hypothetical protein